MSFKSLKQLADKVLSNNQRKKIAAVVAADDLHTLEAAIHAAKDGIISPLLIGDAAGIAAKLEQLGEKPSDYAIIAAATPEECALIGALSVKEGKADFLMKGLINTNVMLKTLFSEQAGFKTGQHISHLGIVEIPTYHKLVGVADSAINVYPTLEHKKCIIENSVQTMRRMGIDLPKVAVLAATEIVNPKMPETVDAQLLKEMNQKGEIANCIVEGPISFDLAISSTAAEIKKYVSPVAGDADLFIVPNITAGNILIKSLRYAANAASAGIVIGGRSPVVLTSRAVEPQDKYWPLVLAASVSI